MICLTTQDTRRITYITLEEAVSQLKTPPDSQIRLHIHGRGDFVIDAYEWNSLLERAKRTMP